MATRGLDDALVSYLTDKYSEDQDDAQMKEIEDLPDSASVGGSDGSVSSSSDSGEDEEVDESSSSSDADTVIDDRQSRSEAERLKKKKIREDKRERKKKREEKREERQKKKEKKERKRKRKAKKDDKEKKRRKTSRDDTKSERSSSKRRDDRERSSSKRRDERDQRSSSRSTRDDRERSNSRRRSPSPSASVKSFRSVHADFRYGKDERRSSSRARSRSPDRHSSMSERPYKSGRSKRSRSRSPKNGRAGKKDYGAAGARTIPPPSGLYTMREHSGSDSGSSDADEDDKYRGSGLSKEDKMKLLEIAKKNALNVHGGLNKNESIAIRAGGLTIEQLTAKCHRVAEGKEDPVTEQIPDDMLNHPFAVIEKAPEQLTFRPIFLKPKQVDPLALPADASMAALTKSFPVSAGIQHREVISDYDLDKVGVGEWTEGQANENNDDSDSDDDDGDNGAENGENGDKAMSMVDIQSAIADRVNAMRKLQENPDDVEAMNQMETAQELLSNWTGGTGPEDNKIMPMSWAELNTGNPAWAKKEQFHVARKVEGLGKKLLEKMGWKEGMGLGKNAQGNAEPLVLDFKINREGLSSTEEGTNGPSFMGRKGFAGGIVKDLSGKHPVSALMEVCSKRRWGQPEFTLLTDPGPGNNRSFLYKVRVYDTEYQPATPSLNKKTAKAASATVALQALGLVPRA